MVTWTI